MQALAFDYHNGMKVVTLSTDLNPTDSRTEDAIAENGARKGVIEGFKMILLDGHQFSTAIRNLKSAKGHKWIKRPFRFVRVTHRYGEGIRQTEAFTLP